MKKKRNSKVKEGEVLSHLRLVHSQSNIVVPKRESPPTLHKGKTCRKDCTFYDDDLQNCPMFGGVNYDDPKVANRCLEFKDSSELQSYYQDFSNGLDESMEKEEWEKTEQTFFLEDDLITLLSNEENHYSYTSLYPFQPDVRLDEQIENLHWFVSEDLSFGCWIQDNNKKLDYPQSTKRFVVLEQGKQRYKSPIPLIDHKASANLQSRMVWIVDEKGYGKYGMGIADKIHIIEMR